MRTTTTINIEHLCALIIMGIGGILALLTGHIDIGAVLLGAIGGYAFKNGIKIEQQKLALEHTQGGS